MSLVTIQMEVGVLLYVWDYVAVNIYIYTQLYVYVHIFIIITDSKTKNF